MNLNPFKREEPEDADSMDMSLEPENVSDDAPEPEPTPQPAAWTPDDAFLDSLADRVAQKMAPPKADPPPAQADNPYAAAASKFYDDPEAAVKAIVEIAQMQNMGVIAPVIGDHAFTKATADLSPEERSAAAQIISENKWDARAMADPNVADLVKSKAKLTVLEKSGKLNEKPVPQTESATYTGNRNVDAELNKELAGIRQMALDNGVKLTPEMERTILQKAGAL